MTCTACPSTDVLTVALELSGDPVAFHHCRACEHRWWARPAGSSMQLGDVLASVAS